MLTLPACQTGAMTPAERTGPHPAFEAVGVVLAGGAGRRLGGVDKALLHRGGTPLIDRALQTLRAAGCRRLLVVGPPRPSTRPGIEMVREEPAGVGPAAAIVAAAWSAIHQAPDRVDDPAAVWLLILAVDMPLVSAATYGRLREAAQGHDGAFLTDSDGRRHLAGVLRAQPLLDAHPHREVVAGMSVRRLLAGIRVATPAPRDGEAADVDTPEDAIRLLD